MSTVRRVTFLAVALLAALAIGLLTGCQSHDTSAEPTTHDHSGHTH